MANALTGDFEAVLQVSAGMLDRLLASMHQNAAANPQKPTMPHSAYMRIGDEHPVDGVRGSVQAQIGVPRLELIDGATDRFRLEVGVRARFRGDPDSEFFPEIIQGTVRAEYHLQEIDPRCWGWAGIAEDYLWIRVVEGSVSFSGTASPHVHERLGPELAVDMMGIEDRIATQVTELLEKRFQATPQELTSKRFRRGAMRSLNRAGGAGVVIPVGLAGATPVGRVDSVNDVFLAGSDMSVAIGREFIESLAQPALDPLVGYQRNVHWHWDLDWGGGAEVDYSVRIDNASVEWGTLGPFGVIKLRVDGQGWAPRVYKSGFATVFVPDASELSATFSAEQLLLITFEQPLEHLKLLGPPFPATSVTVNYNGPRADDVKSGAATMIANAVQGRLGGIQQWAQPQIDTMTSDERKAELRKQLQTIDDQAAIRFQSADFSPDGVVVHGSISLSPRAAPVVSFQKTPEGDGFDAWSSWIPGGRIDSFDWSWTWFDRTEPPGGKSIEDRFVLLRPADQQRGKYALGVSVEHPLPGLDGWGRVCLALGGVQVDSTTGALVRIRSRTDCERFGYPGIIHRLDGDRLLLREYVQARDPAPGEPVETGMVSAATPASVSTTNTLVVYADERWGEETTRTLREGLARCGREDAGLMVLALFHDGRLDQRQAAELSRLAPELEAQVLVNEDVRGSWARALALPSGRGGVAWRLLSPGGGVTWMHDGDPPVETLSQALDACLLTSAAPQPVPLRPVLNVGAQIYRSGVGSWLGGLIGRHCPPPPVSRFGVGSVVTFVQGDSTASKAELDRIAHEYGEDGEGNPFVVVIADGMDTAEAERLADQVGGGFATIGDPHGVAADRMGVHVWPTTVALDAQGVVRDLRMGAGGDDPGRHGVGAGEALAT